MKKILVISICFGILFLSGCNKKVNVDYSEYSFTHGSWSRDNGHDIETISFKADGSFSYSCACGNPVNDADLCDEFTYNDETKEISLKCIEKTEEMITTFKIISSTDTVLELDFNGEVRRFEKVNEE